MLCARNLEETVEHLFLYCDLVRECWSRVGSTVGAYPYPYQIFEDFRAQLNVPFFMEIIIVMCWSIWVVRNDVIFRGVPASNQRCLAIFKLNFGLLLLRAKKMYFP